MDLEKNKQRLEILAAEVEELKNNGGGGGTVDAYTKAEADNKFAEKTNVYTKTEADNKFAEKTTTYTKTEVDEAIASAAGGDVIVSGDNVKTINATAGRNGILIGNGAGFNPGADSQIAIGVRSGANSPYNFPISIGYQAKAYKSGITIGSYSADNATGNAFSSVILGWNSTANSSNDVILGHHLNATADGQILLGCFNKTSNEQGYFAVGNGNNAARSNLFSFSNNLFYCGNDTTGYDLRYFAPADETLTDGGTISATALANALKHVPLSFNAHVCYYSYEDNDNVYYTSTRLNGTSLHTNVVAINKTTGVATFNEFDQS